MRKVSRSLFLLAFVLMMSSIGFFSCSGLTGAGGSLSLRLPGGSSRNADSTYLFEVELDGPSAQRKSGKSGETIVFNGLSDGKYCVNVEAFDCSTMYYYAKGSAFAEVKSSVNSSVTVELCEDWLVPEIIEQPSSDVSVTLSKKGESLVGTAELCVSARLGDEKHRQSGRLEYMWYPCDESGTVAPGATCIVANETCSINYGSSDANKTYYYICKVRHADDSSTGKDVSVFSSIVKVNVSGEKILSNISATFGNESVDCLINDGGTIGIDYSAFKVKRIYEDGTSETGAASSEWYEITYDEGTYSFSVGNITFTVKEKSDGTTCTLNVPVKYRSDPLDVEVMPENGNFVVNSSGNVCATVSGIPEYFDENGGVTTDAYTYAWYCSSESSVTDFSSLTSLLTGECDSNSGTIEYAYTPDEIGTLYLYFVVTAVPGPYSASYKGSPVVSVGSCAISVNPVTCTTWDDLKTKIQSGTDSMIMVSGNMMADSSIEVSREITLVAEKSGGCTVVRGSGFTGSFFTVNDGGNLILGASGGDLTFDGGAGSSISAQSAVIKAELTGATNINILRVEIGPKCTIQNNTVTSGKGGGIYYSVRVPNGIKKTDDTNVQGVVINGGIIKNCIANGGGGIYYKTNNPSGTVNQPKLCILSGSVEQNTANGKDCNGGGIYLDGGYMLMSGGSIKSNVSNLGRPVGASSGPYGGGGIYMKSGTRLDLSGGEISGNGATNAIGGGIFAASESVYLSVPGDADVKENTAATGPNIYSAVILNGTTYNFVEQPSAVQSGEWGYMAVSTGAPIR